MSTRDLVIFGTASQHPTRFRNHGGYLFRWNGEGFLFDPGEGTQRQFIFANVPPTQVTRVFVSHFHGDHCLGLGSMLMRLNLDGVKHVHCYYPASGQKYFDRLVWGTIYHQHIQIHQHPIDDYGLIEETDSFHISAYPLEHGHIQNVGYRIEEKSYRKFDKQKLAQRKIQGADVRTLLEQGFLDQDGQKTDLDEVSHMQKGEAIGVMIDTRPCEGAHLIARDCRVLLAESTYLHQELVLAKNHHHLTAIEAAQIACDSSAQELILTHFSARYQNPSLFEQQARTVFPKTIAAKDLDVYSFPKNQRSFILRQGGASWSM